MSKKVKNVSGQDLALINIGVVKAGETVTVPDDFNNPNFEVAGSGKTAEAAEKSDADADAPKSKEKGDKK